MQPNTCERLTRASGGTHVHSRSRSCGTVVPKTVNTHPHVLFLPSPVPQQAHPVVNLTYVWYSWVNTSLIRGEKLDGCKELGRNHNRSLSCQSAIATFQILNLWRISKRSKSSTHSTDKRKTLSRIFRALHTHQIDADIRLPGMHGTRFCRFFQDIGARKSRRGREG